MAGEDPEYLDWIRRRACAACGGPGPCHPHHSTNGGTQPLDGTVQKRKALGGRRGKGQKAHDHEAIPLHLHCHGEFHKLRGHFKGWKKQQLREWQDEQVRTHRTLYEAMLERHPELRRKKPKSLHTEPGASAVTAANAEREAIAALIREHAAEARLLPDVSAALNDVAELLESRAEPIAEGIR